MNEEMKRRFMDMVHEEIGEDHKLAPVIGALVGMIDDEAKFAELYEIHEGIEEYGQFLTEKEAVRIVGAFVNYDGSRGGRWAPQVLFTAVEGLGGKKTEKGQYNCWALFALMNMMHSDYGGAIHPDVQGEAYALMCYRMALAWMQDRDRDNDVREYFLQ